MLNFINLDQKNLPYPLPDFEKSFLKSIEGKCADWANSNYAGFRKILDKNAAEYPNFSSIRAMVEKKKSINGSAIKNFVVLGTGGSSLGTEAIIRALHPVGSKIKFFILENNDPDFFHQHIESWNAKETLFYVVSKSGGTPETISQFLVAAEWIKQELQGKWKEHFVFCTDPQKSELLDLSKKTNIDCLSVPSTVGGRFSVLTAVGLFPAAFAGLNIEKMIQGAQSLAHKLEENTLDKNPSFQLAYRLTQMPQKITVSMPYSSLLYPFSRWFCQLWAESLGKNGKGLTPYPAIGTVDQHSQIQLYMEGPKDKVVSLIEVEKSKKALPLPSLLEASGLKSFGLLENKTMEKLLRAELYATRDALTEAGIPNFTIKIKEINEESLGALFYFWEITTVYAGALFNIDPFTQPGVEAGKLLTKKYLQEQ